MKRDRWCIFNRKRVSENEAATKASKLARNTDARLQDFSAGASLWAEDADKQAPAHVAAQNGDEGCLRVLHLSGAGASLCAENANKETPAHYAAWRLRTATRAACECCTSSAPVRACSLRI
jgi:hypothetical protein